MKDYGVVRASYLFTKNISHHWMAQKTKYIIVLIVTFLGFIAIEIFKPKPTVWVPTYSNADDIPYGGQILYRILPELFRALS